MSADPKKLGAMVVESLGPPDRLKKRPPKANADGEPDMPPDDEGDSDQQAGEMAMDDFRKAADAGDSAAMFAALKTAVSHCSDDGGGDAGG
jgi:hypothetical protein